MEDWLLWPKKIKQKADLLYDEIDANPLFEGAAAEEDRSLMNVTFTMKDPALEDAFLEACIAAGCEGVKGHRSVGGFRASIYNAMPIESVQVLVDLMKDFARKKLIGFEEEKTGTKNIFGSSGEAGSCKSLS